MSKICTSIEQSKRLVGLGIDVNTADMFWAPDANIIVAEPYVTKTEDETLIPAYKGAIPAWSLTALLDILTEQSFIIKTIGNEFNIDIPIRHCKIWFSSLLDAAFEMVIWLLENNKL